MKLKRHNTLNEDEKPKITYKVKVETMDNPLGDHGSDHIEIETEVIDSGESDTREGAMKIKREMMKKHELINHAGHIVNFKKRLELFTNF